MIHVQIDRSCIPMKMANVQREKWGLSPSDDKLFSRHEMNQSSDKFCTKSRFTAHLVLVFETTSVQGRFQEVFTAVLLLCCCFLACFIFIAVPFIEVITCFLLSSLSRFSSSSSTGSAPSLFFSPSSARSLCWRKKSSYVNLTQ